MKAHRFPRKTMRLCSFPGRQRHRAAAAGSTAVRMAQLIPLGHTPPAEVPSLASLVAGSICLLLPHHLAQHNRKHTWHERAQITLRTVRPPG